jgi:hypothetical protein
MSVTKSFIQSASAAVFLFGFTAAASAMPGGGRPIKAESDYGTLPVQYPASEGRQVDHPAWSFGCAESDVGTRAIPCDEPIYVYGQPCEVGTGIDQWRQCTPTREGRSVGVGRTPR